MAMVTVVIASCGTPSTVEDAGQSVDPSGPQETPSTAPGEAAELFAERLDLIDGAVEAWANATTVEAAHAAAETAANLVVGPGGPGYGDREGDGEGGGEVSAGLLPGLDGTPPGLATALADNACVARDVLGGTWADPGAEWQKMLTAIDDWRPNNNTMPTLASHPMRIVGWATFSLASDSLDTAREYAGHAKIHVDVSRRALDC